jgi:hypothetical protein
MSTPGVRVRGGTYRKVFVSKNLIEKWPSQPVDLVRENGRRKENSATSMASEAA